MKIALSLKPLPGDIVRALLKGHSALGLAFSAVLYLICLTGTLAVFVHEFERWENPGAPRLAGAAPAAVQHAYVEAIRRTQRPVEHVIVQMPDATLPFLRLTTEDENGTRRSWYADASGELAGAAREGWTQFLIRLHINLHLPRSIGLFIVGLAGVALLSSLISGVLAHPRIFRDAFHLRLGGSRRLQEADLHNRIGIWALPFHLIVSLTGALLGLSTIIIGALGLAVFQGDSAKVYALFTPPHPIEDPRPAPPLDLRPMFAAVEHLSNGPVDYVFVEHPTERGGAALFNVEDGSRHIARLDSFAFDRSLRLYHQQRAGENNLGQAILGSLGQLHFGWFGGGLLRIAYGLLGLGLCYLSVGGVNIWLARRRDKGRPALFWERMWPAVTWGQPIALAAAALGALLLPASPASPILVWSILTVLSGGFALLRDPGRVRRTARLGAGMMITALALVHASMFGQGDAIARAVDIILASLGALIVALSLPSRLRAGAG